MHPLNFADIDPRRENTGLMVHSFHALFSVSVEGMA